ncbi:MAG TPA: gephyrin-like molybdotransferase Glp [Marinagarivorans sp.]
MISVETAIDRLRQTPSLQLAKQRVPLEQALGYRVAENIVAEHNVPPADNSAMDGYAVRLRDLLAPGSNNKAPALPISQRIPAGIAPTALAPNSCARIFTGGEIPEGADTVIMQENVSISGDWALFPTLPQQAGENIRRRGQDIIAGQALAQRGQKITPALLGLLASQGFGALDVQRPLKITLLSTGDEIVEPGKPLAAGKIYNSNFYTVSALLKSWGRVEINYQHVADTLEATIAAFQDGAAQSDLIISFGGVSVGEEDHVKAAASAVGQLELWKIKLKPGKPLMLGSIGQTPLLGLPGNPVSAFVTFTLFAKVLLNALTATPYKAPLGIKMPIGFAIRKARQRPEYIRASLQGGYVHAAGNQSSGVLSSVNECEGLALIPEDTDLKRGDNVVFYPLESLIHG